jgi:PleD family two-component response regulator
MTQPLALVFYEKLLPGTQVVNRLQDLNYRVQTVTEAASLARSAEQSKPLVVVVDLVSRQNRVCAAIRELRQNAATQHLPVIAFGDPKDIAAQGDAVEAGASLVVSDAAILNHLPQCLDRALQIE